MTGDTARAQLDLLSKTGLHPTHIVAVLANDPGNDTTKTITLSHRGKEHRVSYFMKADFALGTPDTCSLCLASLPPSELGNDPYDVLTTFEHWSMAKTVGTGPEQTVPSYRQRQAFSRVIKYPDMIGLHGPWLASKIGRLLSKDMRELPAEIVFVCPYKEKGSEVLATCLNLLLGVTVIRVPRGTIDAARGGLTNDQWTNIESGHPEWLEPT